MPHTPFTLSTNDIADIERATLDAVAPREIETVDGWLLPFDNSSIGRAKSAVPLRHDGLHTEDLVHIAQRYEQRQLVPAFRLADAQGLSALHAELSRQGYTAQQPSLVQVGSVDLLGRLGTPTAASVSKLAHAPWAQVYSAEGFDAADGQSRVRSLTRGTHSVYATVVEGEVAVAAGVASFSHGWASLHGIRTLAHARGRGLASQVLAGLAREAAARGLQRVFLQVEEHNKAALSLYQRAGFVTAWRYQYWRRADPSQGQQHC